MEIAPFLALFRFWRLILAAISGFALATCSPKAPGPLPKLDVSWELVSNFLEEDGMSEARFILLNTGAVSLADTGWTLYFNMAPRYILPHPEMQAASLGHMNGDWFYLKPNPGFLLHPGDTIAISYRQYDFVIKTTDAPLGLYLTLDQPKGPPAMIPLGDARVVPFARQDQRLRGKNDAEPLPDPEFFFAQYAALHPAEGPPIVPEPAAWTWESGEFMLQNGMEIVYSHPSLEREARRLSSQLTQALGGTYPVRATSSAAHLSLSLRMDPPERQIREAYTLKISPEGIEIKGADPAGVFYGIQSLVALLPLEAWAKQPSSARLRSIHIQDQPRFPFRSMHLDVGRNFQTKESVMRLLDVMAFYKLNRFLFYLTEDEGWRLEIPGLPELAQVGGQRGHQVGMEAAGLHPAYGSGPMPYAEGGHGSGYYSRKDFIEILAYARDRHIQVIPEVNLPGHARAAIKAMEARYERLLREGKPDQAEACRLIDPSDCSEFLSAQGYKDNVADVTRASVYEFYATVTDAIAAMYAEAGLKLSAMHIGGDEVPDGAWTQNAAAQRMLAQQPEMESVKNLHAYFIRKLAPLLEQRGIEIHCWEEAALRYKADGTYEINPEFAGRLIPYIWNNVYDPDLGYRIANAGYKTVLCNVSNFYFDLAYNNSPEEPGLYWAGFVDTRDAFLFDPFHMFNTTFTDAMGKPMVFDRPTRLTPAGQANIIGVEAQLWSETVKGRDMMEYYTLPKLLGFAQSAWGKTRPWEGQVSEAGRRSAMFNSWNAFANALAQKELPRLSYLNGGYTYRVPPPGGRKMAGMLEANAAFPGLEIRFTSGDSLPTRSSKRYEGPTPLAGSAWLRCFDAAGRASKAVKVE